MFRHSSKLILAGLAAVAVQTTTGCSSVKKMDEQGSANVSVTQSLSVLGDVKAVEVTVTGADVPAAMTMPLFKQADNSWKGLINHIPAGMDRTFSAKAFDASHVEIYSGSVPKVQIDKDQIANVTIVLQENQPNAGFANHAPVIDGLTVSSSKAIYGQKIAYTLTAHDPDAGQTATLVFTPSDTCGNRFGTPTITTVGGNRVWTALWTAPMSGTECQLNMEVKDVLNAKTMSATKITLWSGQDTGGARVDTLFQSYPVISNIEATPVAPALAFELNAGLLLNVVATQPDGENMTYAWSTPCTGSFDDASKKSPVFTLTAAAPSCIFSVVVSNPDKTQSDLTVKHMSTTGSLEVVVGAKAAAPELGGLVIDLTSQSQEAINSGESVTLYVRARETNAGATLSSYAWSTVGGGLGTQTDAADMSFSQIVWTAPVGFSTAQNITVLVTDSQGSTASYTFAIRSATNPCAGATDGTLCSDGNPCTVGDSCQAGVCTGGPQKSCPAIDACHDVGVCDVGTGACSTPPKAEGTGCTLADACVTGAACSGGTCVATSLVTCTAMDDCHSAGTCSAGVCSDPVKPNGTSCNGSAPDACHLAAVCTEGLCGNPVAPDTTTCSTGNKCLTGEHCVSGSCGSGSAVVCADPGVCKTATCVPSTGCVVSAAPEGAPCSDGDGCTVGDSCVSGACVSTGPLMCVASDKCHTVGSCTAGACPAEIAVTCTQDQSCDTADGQCYKPCPAPNYARNFGVSSMGGMTVDASGNQVVVAKLFGTVNFGTTGTPVNLTSVGSSDIALAKLDPTTGNAVWGVSFGGSGENANPSDQIPSGVAVNKDGKIAMIGTFTSNLIVNGGLTINGAASALDFVMGTSATGVGEWGFKVDTISGGLQSIASNPARSEFVVCGYALGGVTDLGLNGSYNGDGLEDVILAKLSDTGSVIWARQIGGAGTQLCKTVALGADGTVYAAGLHNGTIDFGDGALPVYASSVQAVWIGKFDSADGHAVVSKSFGTAGKQAANGITVDAQGNVFVAGNVRGSIPFGAYTVASAGNLDAYAVMLDSSLVPQWAKRWGDAAADQVAKGLSLNSYGDLVVVGYIKGNSGTLTNIKGQTFTLTSLGLADAYWLKLRGSDGVPICGAIYGNSGYDQSMDVVAISRAATGAQKDMINTAGYGNGTWSVGSNPVNSTVANGFVAQLKNP